MMVVDGGVVGGCCGGGRQQLQGGWHRRRKRREVRHQRRHRIALPPVPPSVLLCICVGVRGGRGGRRGICIGVPLKSSYNHVSSTSSGVDADAEQRWRRKRRQSDADASPLPPPASTQMPHCSALEATIEEYFKPIDKSAEIIMNMQLQKDEKQAKEMLKVMQEEAMIQREMAQKKLEVNSTNVSHPAPEKESIPSNQEHLK
ncbi:hypothetical protein BHE74_00050326 [Ensete ventricosum]|nr:hypothetical protein BHE74_00050326 [Ensete ventricosum]